MANRDDVAADLKGAADGAKACEWIGLIVWVANRDQIKLNLIGLQRLFGWRCILAGRCKSGRGPTGSLPSFGRLIIGELNNAKAGIDCLAFSGCRDAVARLQKAGKRRPSPSTQGDIASVHAAIVQNFPDATILVEGSKGAFGSRIAPDGAQVVLSGVNEWLLGD